MKTESTTYKCDGPACAAIVTITKDNPVFGPSPVDKWIILANNHCFCCMECLIAWNEEPKPVRGKAWT